MKVSAAKGLFSIGLAAVCAIGMGGCSGGSSSGGVAATVNGVEISEDKITTSIERLRTSMGLETDDAWGEYLVTYSYTPESIREQTIDSYIQQELIREAAEEYDVVIDSDTVDGYVEQVRAYYDSDEAWQAALESVGTTEEEYRQDIETSLMDQELQEVVVTVDDPSEEDLMEYASTIASYYDGAKRSSHILFSSDDEETAQLVLDQINAGEIDFVEAAQEYSLDSSAEDGGDVGWDALATFVDEYQDALDELSVGEVSGLVTSQYGIHIIMCTEEFTVPDELTSTDQLPEEIRDELVTYVQQQQLSTAYSDWFELYEEAADIVINDMPSGLSYDIDLTPYETEEETTDDTSDDSTTDETTSTDEETSSDEEEADDATSSDSSDEEATDDSSEAGSSESEDSDAATE